MKKRLFYSLGCLQTKDEYQEKRESFVDVRTLKKHISLLESCEYEDIVIIGEVIETGDGGYNRSKVGIHELYVSYTKLLNNNDEDTAIDMLLKQYNAKKYDGKYSNRYIIK